MDYLYIITCFKLDSNGRSRISLTHYNSLKEAETEYEKFKNTLNFKNCYIDEDGDSDLDQKIIETYNYIDASFTQRQVWEDGSWKRPCGYQLSRINLKETGNRPLDIIAWPNVRSYN